jgi:hypothetical protein
MHISINFTGPEINDHVNPSDLQKDSNSWPLRSKLKTWPVKLFFRVNG